MGRKAHPGRPLPRRHARARLRSAPWKEACPPRPHWHAAPHTPPGSGLPEPRLPRPAEIHIRLNGLQQGRHIRPLPLHEGCRPGSGHSRSQRPDDGRMRLEGQDKPGLGTLHRKSRRRCQTHHSGRRRPHRERGGATTSRPCHQGCAGGGGTQAWASSPIPLPCHTCKTFIRLTADNRIAEAPRCDLCKRIRHCRKGPACGNRHDPIGAKKKSSESYYKFLAKALGDAVQRHD